MFGTGCDPIPQGLAEMPPGPGLAGFLASIDVDRVSGHDRVIVLRAAERQASHARAQVLAAMASLADHMDDVEFPDDPELGWRAASTEIRAALRLTRRAAEGQLELAISLRTRLPRVFEALRAGSIDTARAHVLSSGTSHLDDATARRVVDALIDDAPTLTTGQLREKVRKACLDSNPGAADEQYRTALDRRRLVMEASPEGTAHLLGLDLPPDKVVEATSHIERLAKELSGSDDRTIDQIRADVFIDLITGARRDTKGGIVDIHVDLDTLAELDASPADLAGYGPVVADIARQVAEAQVDGEWRFTISDPETGLPVHDGTTRRRPTAAQRRSVEARDRHCVFPGCRMPARQCDLDHRTPWAESHRTSSPDLDPACRYDHVTVRHKIGWNRQSLPGGDHLWSSPLGHRYTTSGRRPP